MKSVSGSNIRFIKKSVGENDKKNGTVCYHDQDVQK